MIDDIGGIEELDVIELMDGREVVVHDVYANGKGFFCEDPQAIEDGKEMSDVLIDVSPEDVKRVIWRLRG